MNRLGVPIAVELQPVRAVHARMDIRIEALERGLWWDPWDVELDHGAQLTVYRDLNSGRWFALAPARVR